MTLRSISLIDHPEGKRIIVRADLNVPIVKGKIRDPFRITRALPTLQFLAERGAKVIIITHLGDDGSASLAPVATLLKEKLRLTYSKEADKKKIEIAVAKMKNGEVLLLPNIRAFDGEMKNDTTFAEWLASLGEVYVNDAFSVSHREHASIVLLPKYLSSYAGFQLFDEVAHLSLLREHPAQPFVALFGGAKLSTKLPLIQKFSKTALSVAVGGALANQVYYARGWEIGKSLHDEEKIKLSLFEKGKVFVPSDVVVVRGKKTLTISAQEVEKKDVIVDIGPTAVSHIKKLIASAHTVLWNGPMGKYEEGFGGATETILKLLARSKAKTIIGGGDTVALVTKLGILNKFFFVSTGGGATLAFLSKGTLPGIQALKRGKK